MKGWRARAEPAWPLPNVNSAQTQVTHFARDSEGLERTSPCLQLALTVQIRRQHAYNVLCHWTISLGIHALCQLYRPALICRSRLLKISPPSLSLSPSVLCSHTEEVLVFRDHDCKGVLPKIYIKKAGVTQAQSSWIKFCLLLVEEIQQLQLFQFMVTCFFFAVERLRNTYRKIPYMWVVSSYDILRKLENLF